MSAALLFTTHTAECTDMPASLGPRRPFLELHEAGAAGPPSNKGPPIMPAYTVLFPSDIGPTGRVAFVPHAASR